MNRVVVTGLGVLAPNGNGIEEFIRALQDGKSGIRFIERLKDLQFGCQLGGTIQNVEPLRLALFSEEDRLTMNQGLTYAAIAGIECWKDAGMPYSQDNFFEDTGAIIGVGLGGMDTIAQILVPMVNAGKTRRMGSTLVENSMASGPSAKLGGFLGLGGQVTTNSSACTTGTEAVVEAYYKIKEGRLTRMLAGGVESGSEYIWAGFDAMRVLPRNFNDRPEQGSRPMSATAEGFVPGSGGGILMLEDLDAALKRGARIYAEIIGAEVNSGGQRFGGSMTAPSPQGVVRCIKMAMKRAGIQGHDIDLVNGHLTGTFADPYEVKNWQQALELSSEKFPYIQSTKSMIGHTLGAAGGIECVAAVLQLYHGFIHGSINSEDLHPDLIPYRDSIPQKTIKHDLNIVAKAGFGFGDVNGCIIFKKWKE